MSEDIKQSEEIMDDNSIDLVKRGIAGGLGMLEKALETYDVQSENWKTWGII